MTCFHPMRAWKILDDGESKISFKRPKENKYCEELQIPCGKCIGCKLDHANQWATRCYVEAKQWEQNCFITLTYNGNHLPKNGLLCKKDLQDFMKRLRYYHKGNEKWKNPRTGKTEYPIRFLACGEYGPSEKGTHRPHYHILIFNWKPKNLKFYKWNKQGDPIYISQEITKIWGKGFTTIEDMNYKTACYVARYTDKKLFTKENREIAIKNHLQPEFIEMSRNGGIGIQYWKENKKQILKQNGILIKMKDKVKNRQIPKYYEYLYKNENENAYKKYQIKKQTRALKVIKETLAKTDLSESEYLRMQERILLEKVKTLKRNNFV